MRLIVIAVGKAKEPALREWLDDYLARIRTHVPCSEIELRDGKHVEQALRAAIPPEAYTVALEVFGTAMTSEDLSRLIQRKGSENKGTVAFVIGGADGIPKAISSQAHLRMSLSAMTLPHRIARLVLTEQLYRAISIWKGTPYHRA